MSAAMTEWRDPQADYRHNRASEAAETLMDNAGFLSDKELDALHFRLYMERMERDMVREAPQGMVF